MAKVLIVDDSKFMRRIIKEALESAGHEIIAEADNAYDGVEIYKTYTPDIVTMDITMAGKDGSTAVQEIKKFKPDSKVIVVSALSEKVIKSINDEIHPDAFITKPFEKQDLLDAVNRILA